MHVNINWLMVIVVVVMRRVVMVVSIMVVLVMMMIVAVAAVMVVLMPRRLELDLFIVVMRVLDALLMLVVVMMFINARFDVGEFGLRRLMVVFVIMLVAVGMRALAAVVVAVRPEDAGDLMQNTV